MTAATYELDMFGVWRWSHCRRGHEFTDENVYTCPKGIRHCKACRALGRLVRATPKPLVLTCPHCKETRTVRFPQKPGKRFAPEVCQRCTARRLPQCQPRPKPPVVLVPKPDPLAWMTAAERETPEQTWLRLSPRARREIGDALASLPIDDLSERTAA